MNRLAVTIAVLALSLSSMAQTTCAASPSKGSVASCCVTPPSGHSVLMDGFTGDLVDWTDSPWLSSVQVKDITAGRVYVYDLMGVNATVESAHESVQLGSEPILFPANDEVCAQFTNTNTNAYESVTFIYTTN